MEESFESDSAAAAEAASPSIVKHTRDVPPFVQVLFDVLSDTRLSSIVTWNIPKPGFTILDQAAFVSKILPRLCQTKSFDTFVRQLHCYGFSKQRGSNPVVVHHTTDMFRKGEPALLKNIQRNRTAKKRADLPVPAMATKPVKLPSVDAPAVPDIASVQAGCTSPQSSCADPPVVASAGRRTRPRPLKSGGVIAAPPPCAISDDVVVSSQRTAQAPEQERAPKVQKTIAAYQSVIVDAITTMKVLLDKARDASETGGNTSDVDVVSTVSKFIDRSGPLLSALTTPNDSAVAGAMSLDSVSIQLSALLSAINVDEADTDVPAAPAPSPPSRVQASTDITAVVEPPSETASSAARSSEYTSDWDRSLAAVRLDGSDAGRLTPLLTTGRYLARQSRSNSSASEDDNASVRVAPDHDGGSGATCHSARSPLLPAFDGDLTSFLSQLELTSLGDVPDLSPLSK